MIIDIFRKLLDDFDDCLVVCRLKVEFSMDFIIYLIYFRLKCIRENIKDVKLFRVIKL